MNIKIIIKAILKSNIFNMSLYIIIFMNIGNTKEVNFTWL